MDQVLPTTYAKGDPNHTCVSGKTYALLYYRRCTDSYYKIACVPEKKSSILHLQKVHNTLACGLSQKYYVFNHITCTVCSYTSDQINYSCKELRFHVNHGNMSGSAETAVWSQNPLIYE